MKLIETVRKTLWHEPEKGFFTMDEGTQGQLLDLKRDRMPYGPWRHFKKQLERKGEDRYCVCVIKDRFRMMDKMDIRPVNINEHRAKQKNTIKGFVEHVKKQRK